MSRHLQGAAFAALTVAAALAAAGSASAQSYNRLVVFGDSLSDNGNLYAATGGAQPPAPFYWQGRFSNGPVFTELLGFNAGRLAAGAPVTGNINLAFGGAVTGTAALPLGLRSQLATYQGMGGLFGPNDLVTVLGGANNIFQGLPAAGASVNPAGAIAPVSLAAAADINFIVDAVAGAGAGTVLVVNLPKLSLTPQFGGTAAAPLADYAVTTFNGALSTQLIATAAARPGANIILMDIYKIGDTIAANPGQFGVSNVTAPCFNQTLLSVCSNPDDYFYFDGVHPTAAGHRVLAALADDYLYYGDAGAETALQAENGLRFREEALEAVGDSLSARRGWGEGSNLTFGGAYDRIDVDARGVVGAAEIDGWGLRLGLDHSTSENWRFALAGQYRQSQVKGVSQTFDIESFALDAGLGWRSGSVFANVSAGASIDNYDDIRRRTTLPVVHQGETGGTSAGARVQVGWWWSNGALDISPRAALTWASADVDAYYEQGVAAQYSYQDRTVETINAEAVLRAEGDFGGGTFFIEGGWRESLSDSFDAVGTGILGSPSHVLYRDVETPFGSQALASAGFETQWAGAKVTFAYRGRFADNADSHTGAINFSIPLP